MLLQSFADDSVAQTGDKRLHIAGYLNGAHIWTVFDDAWKRELLSKPSIKHLKMIEAQHLRGEFQGWTTTARDKKLAALARVIREFDPVSFQVSVSTLEFEQFVRPHAPYGLKTPYFPCIFLAVSTVAQFAAQIKRGDMSLQVDFIFDEQQGVSKDIAQTFKYMARNLPSSAQKLINGTPMFRSDAELVPLQAADMLAWHVRREHEDGQPLFGLTAAEDIRGANHFVSEIDSESLKRWGHAFSRTPNLESLQTKSQWKDYRKQMQRLLDAGFIPPYGTRWRNFSYPLRNQLANFISRK